MCGIAQTPDSTASRVSVLVFGHEITGEVHEVSQGVELIKKGDLCRAPSSISCKR
ncbi:alcohol dehydrogenase catalytic domain-containing protein [Polaromonas sp.]|uniref:alcohol dehydrogenase catalytic domain-containing protein n=1 Tax=Polaromonas sp. TaxID=1869339 RepID=UPI001858D3E4|nr:alcohol dehydrogenase catalytic domain-containing protein [Polaromonas sp.]